jgi:hypothetical protein
MQNNTYSYTDEVTYFFETDNKISYTKLINTINVNHSLELVLIQHLVYLKPMKQILSFFKAINKPIIIVFHTVLPNQICN